MKQLWFDFMSEEDVSLLSRSNDEIEENANCHECEHHQLVFDFLRYNCEKKEIKERK